MTHSSNRSIRQLYEFGPFRLDAPKGLLWRDQEVVALKPRLLEMLLLFVESSERVIEKDELMSRLWPDTIVEEANLTVNISALRKALGQRGAENRYIVTVPGRGYRFVAEVRGISERETEVVLERHTSTEIIIEEEKEDSIAPAPSLHSALISRRQPLLRRKLLIGSSIAVVLIGAVWYLTFSARLHSPATGTRFKTIAVLPFKLLGGSDADDYMGVGMADALITRVGSITQFSVRPTSSVLKYAHTEQSLIEVGRGLNVEAVLEGTIRKSGETYRVTVQLVSVETGAPIWTDKFDEKAADVFTVEDRVSAKMADALTLNLSGEEKARLARRPTENAEAYSAYLRGRFHYIKLTPEGIRKAVDYFEEATAMDPNFALAHAALASAYARLGFRAYGTLPPRDTMPKAKAAALRALALDETLAEAHAALGLIKVRYDWDWASAERELQRAIELQPAHAAAHQTYADCLLAMARYDAGLAELKIAEELDPSSYVGISATRLAHLYQNRQYDRLIDVCKNLIELDANSYLAYLVLGMAYEQKRMYEEAIIAARKAIGAVSGKSGEAVLGHIYATMGRRGEALRLVEEFKQAARESYVDPTHVAAIYSGLGDAEQTLAWLEKGYQVRSTWMIYLNSDPRYDWLHGNPKFQNLLRRVGFAA